MRKLYICMIIFAQFLVLFSCNNSMIENGMDSAEDPRRPDINVKHGDTDIQSGDSFQLEFVNGVKVNETSEPISFTIENLGTSDLELTQISLQGNDYEEFSITEPSANVIPAGTNRTFTISLTPVDTETKSVNIIISNNDPDEPEYSITLNGRSSPVADFIARRRKAGSPLTVDFIDCSLPAGKITSWNWDFQGDGIIDSTEQNPTYIYTAPGDYTVVLEVEMSGDSNYKISTNYISFLSPEKNTINSNFTGAMWVHSADVDKDGDNDVMAGARFDGQLAWWDNIDISTAGTGNATEWQKYIINTTELGYNGATAADIDEDGYIDIIGAGLTGITSGTNRLFLYLNNGTSLWTESGPLGTYHRYDPFAIDLDRDNDIDFLTPSVPSWQANDGSENFTDNSLEDALSDPLTASSLLTQIYAADFDEDGDIDIAGARRSGYYYNATYQIVWWENDGYQNFSTEHLLLTSDSIFTLNIADVNNDGYTDILLSGGGSYSISWLANDGEGNFTTAIIDTDMTGDKYYLSAADIEDDGDIDIIGAGPDTNEIVWWENDGSLFFTLHVLDNNFNGASSVAAADIDGDSIKEIIGTASDANEVAWWETKVSEWYEHTVDGSFGGACQNFAADMDSDGDTDMVGVGNTAVSWWEFSDGKSIYEHNIIEVDSINSAFIIDIDNDGGPDIIYSTLTDIFCNLNFDGSGENWEQVTIDAFSYALVYALELDNDSFADIFAIEQGAPEDITWWRNTDGAGTFELQPVIATGYYGDDIGTVSFGDLNSDGYQDIVLPGTTDGDIIWLENDGSANFTVYSIDSENHYSDAFSSAVGDIDSDGDLDIVNGAYYDYSGSEYPTITWWENETSGTDITWTEHVIDSDIQEVYSIDTADIDNDGDTDIVAAIPDDGKIVLWLNNGSEDFTKEIIKNNFPGVRSITVVDMDEDGDLDLITAADGANDITWWENNLLNFGL